MATMLATLDPMGMPLLGATLSGNGTDESHYLPTWQQLVEIIGHKDFLFLADSKGSTWNNRAKINQEGGIYCFPLAMYQPRPKLLSEWIANPPTALQDICLEDEAESKSPLGQGFEVPLASLWYEKEHQQWYRWSERWFVVCSYALQQRQLKSLSARLSKAELALEKLAKKPPQDEVALQTKVESILKRCRVTGQILTSIEKKISYQNVFAHDRSNAIHLNGSCGASSISGGTAISFATLSRVTQTSDESSHCRKVISCFFRAYFVSLS